MNSQSVVRPITRSLPIDSTAGVVCGAGSMQLSGVRLSVRLSVCPVIRPPRAAAEGLLLWARLAADVDRSLHGRVCNTQQMRATAHVVSWRRKLFEVFAARTIRFAAIRQVNLPQPAALPVENWRILLVQSFTARMPLLTAASTFEIR